MFVNRRRLWAPKASHIPPVTLSFLFLFLFFPFFSTFLSFSLLLYLFFFLFFFRAKNSYSPTTHTHNVLFAFFQFSVLFVLSFLFFSHQSLTHWPTPTQAKRSSASIFNHTPKNSTTHSFSSSLLSQSFFDLAEASKSASTTAIFSTSTARIWPERQIDIHSNDLAKASKSASTATIQSRSSMVSARTSFVGSSFFIWKLLFSFFSFFSFVVYHK